MLYIANLPTRVRQYLDPNGTTRSLRIFMPGDPIDGDRILPDELAQILRERGPMIPFIRLADPKAAAVPTESKLPFLRGGGGRRL